MAMDFWINPLISACVEDGAILTTLSFLQFFEPVNFAFEPKGVFKACNNQLLQCYNFTTFICRNNTVTTFSSCNSIISTQLL